MQFMQRNSPHYLRQLSQMIKHVIFLPGEVILKKGEFGDSLCFLQRGHIEVSLLLFLLNVLLEYITLQN